MNEQNNSPRYPIGDQQIQGRAFYHQMARGVPRFLGDSAKKKDIIEVLFFANGSAGNYTEDVSLGLDTVPLSMVWHLGNVDKAGNISAGGGIVPGSNFDTGTVLEGSEIFSGAKANYSCEKSKLTIKVTSTNVGWPDFIVAYFYYMVFYDDAGVKARGL